MMSLFSSFDLTFYFISFLSIFMFFVMVFNTIYLLNFQKNFIFLTYNFMLSFFSSIKMGNPKSISFFLYSFFVLIFNLNYLSILPFNFSFTSQVGLVLFYSFSFWLSLNLYKFLKNFKGFMIHCIPEGAPLYLVWFLFLIELVSNFIRPITLTVRLVANILAGHLLMILLSKVTLIFFSSIFFYLILNMVEMFVSLIQAYIVVTMLLLYQSEN